MTTYRELFTLVGHMNPVCAVAFSPDGKRIVTVSYAGSAKLWDAATGRELLTLNVNTDGLTSVAFSSDGHGIVTGSPSLRDGNARVWEAAGASQVATWEEEERAAAEAQDRWQKELTALLREQAD
jgi:WD40 repeat protein